MINGNRKDLKVYYQNIPGNLSMDEKITIVQQLIDFLKPDVLAVAEPTTDDLQRDWGDYKLVPGNLNCTGKVRVNVLIKKTIKCRIEKWSTELPTVVIDVDGVKFVFTYREWAKMGDKTTNSMPQQEARWKNFVDKWAAEIGKANVVLTGDLNFDYWSDASVHQQTLNFMRDYVVQKIVSRGYCQKIESNTRYQNNQRPSCLDHLYARTNERIKNVTNTEMIGYDHTCIGYQYSSSIHLDKPVFVETRDIKGINDDDFIRLFMSTQPGLVFTEVDLDMSLKLLCDRIFWTLDQLAPRKRIRIRHKDHAPWMTDHIRGLITLRNNLKQIAVSDNMDISWRQFKVLRNYLRKLMEVTKVVYVNNQVDNAEDSKEMWRLIKAMGMNAEDRNTPMKIKVNGTLTSDPKVVAEHLNNFFLEKVNKIREVTPPDPDLALDYTRQYIGDKVINQMEFTMVNNEDIIKVIAGLKNTGALGVDQIPTGILKRFKGVLAPYICFIVNKAMYTQQYPTMWKCGVVSPVPKKGDLTEDKNWRPVTLLCSMSKIIETVMNKQIKAHLKRHGLIPDAQHAYQEAKSTITAWADLDIFINMSLSKKKLVGALLLDMSAAFNLVSKEVIVPKLKMLGLGPQAANLINSYLSGRVNVTKVAGYFSRQISVPTGIGEGSVLGPLAFILTIVCLRSVLERVAEKVRARFNVGVSIGWTWQPGDVIKIMHVLFADDVTPLVACENEEQLKFILETFMEEYSIYFGAHGLRVNQSKCEHIVFSPGHRQQNIMMDGRLEADAVKLLGVTVTNDYKFNKHAAGVVSRMSMRFPYVSKLKRYLSRDKLIMVASSVCLSVSRYAAEIYCDTEKIQRKIQRKQNALMRLVLEPPKRTSVATMLTQTGWLNVKLQVNLAKLTLLRRCVVSQCSLSVMTQLREGAIAAEHRYATRSRDWKLAWKPTLSRQLRTYLPSTVTMYNRLGLCNQGLDTKRAFKAKALAKLKTIIKNENI